MLQRSPKHFQDEHADLQSFTFDCAYLGFAAGSCRSAILGSQFARAIWDVHQEAPFIPELILSTKLDDEHYDRNIGRVRTDLSRFDADQDRLYFVSAAVQAVVTGWSLFAHALHSARLTQFVEFREAALDSVDRLVSGWSDRVDTIRGKGRLAK